MRVGEAIAALALSVARLRGEVQAMEKFLDQVLAWTRHCPLCGALLRKEGPTEVVKCRCGWVWT